MHCIFLKLNQESLHSLDDEHGPTVCNKLQRDELLLGCYPNGIPELNPEKQNYE